MAHDPTVFLVDSDASSRGSIETIVRSAGWRAASFATAAEFLVFPHGSGPSCLVLDMTLPARHGLALQRLVAERYPDLPVIVVSADCDIPTTVQAIRGGAVELMIKPLAPSSFLHVLERALDSSRMALARRTVAAQLRSRHESLSHRERQVMLMVVSGFLNKQIANELGISEITVKAHRGKVMRKMLANSLAELVMMAARLHLGSNDSFTRTPAWLMEVSHPISLQGAPALLHA